MLVVPINTIKKLKKEAWYKHLAVQQHGVFPQNAALSELSTFNAEGYYANRCCISYIICHISTAYLEERRRRRYN